MKFQESYILRNQVLWQADWQVGRQKYRLILKFFKFGCRLKIFEFSLHLIKVQHHYSLTDTFQLIFWIKPIARLIFKVQNFPKAIQCPTNPYYCILNDSQLYNETLINSKGSSLYVRTYVCSIARQRKYWGHDHSCKL